MVCLIRIVGSFLLVHILQAVEHRSPSIYVCLLICTMKDWCCFFVCSQLVIFFSFTSYNCSIGLFWYYDVSIDVDVQLKLLVSDCNSLYGYTSCRRWLMLTVCCHIHHIGCCCSSNNMWTNEQNKLLRWERTQCCQRTRAAKLRQKLMVSSDHCKYHRINVISI